MGGVVSRGVPRRSLASVCWTLAVHAHEAALLASDWRRVRRHDVWLTSRSGKPSTRKLCRPAQVNSSGATWETVKSTRQPTVAKIRDESLFSSRGPATAVAVVRSSQMYAASTNSGP